MRTKRYLMISLLFLVLLGAFLTIGIINSRRVMMQLIKEQARSFLSIVAATQENSIFAEAEYEDAVRGQLINVCNYLETTKRTATELDRIRQNFQISSIVLLDTNTLKPIVISGTPLKRLTKEKRLNDQERVFFEYFTIGTTKYMRFLFQIKDHFYQLEVSADDIQTFRREFGINKIIQQISLNPVIEYLVLQDKKGILFATPNIQALARIEDDPALMRTFDEGSELNRTTEFNGVTVLELARPFIVENQTFGIFRIGIKLDDYYRHVRSTERQLIILAVILLGAGLVFVYLFNRSESLAGLKEVFHKTLDAIEDGVVVINKNGQITGINTAFTTLSSFQDDMLIGHDYYTRFENDPFAVRRVLGEGSKIVAEGTLFDKQVQYATYPLVDERRTITGAIVVLRDVTQLRLFEREREEAERLKFLGNLVANFAHEIKNPLNGLSIAAQRLHKEFPSEDDEYIRLTTVIQQEINALNKTLNDFLSLARPRMKAETNFSVAGVLKDALALIQEQARTEHFTLNSEVDCDHTLLGDPTALKRAFFNIILNAVDAVSGLSGRAGTVSVTSRRCDASYQIEIRDNGIGMDTEDRERVFKPYFTTKKKGTGLGLYIAQQIIKEHGGSITIDSHKGSGTVFIIAFS
ncbi:PAS domain-containing protein [candidate division WOR-3 bacterium]|nr:PAS domain-containing protein [candidate division WOR-3 bacterium]